MDQKWPGVFVSSTCYDLIDLRAELEPFLRDLGFTPFLSDSSTSAFEVAPDRDSIATCLENVRKCPVFICVLSQRYGPRLGKLAFDDLSATHLEYRTAREAKRAIHFYVRDRLLNEYETWRKNKRSDLTFPWVQKPEDHGLFELIEEREKLVKGADASNYRWPFKNSVDLKDRIAFDLKRESRRLLLTKLLEEGRLPAATPTLRAVSGRELNVMWRNFGANTAFDVKFRVEGGADEWTHLQSIGPGREEVDATIHVPVAGKEATVTVQYSSQAGHVVEDVQRLEPGSRPRLMLIRRSLVETPAFAIG